MDNLQLVAFDAKCKAEKPHTHAECKRLWFLYWELSYSHGVSYERTVEPVWKDLNELWNGTFGYTPGLVSVYTLGQNLWNKQSQEEN